MFTFATVNSILIFYSILGLAWLFDLSNLKEQILVNLAEKYNLKVSDELNKSFLRAQTNVDYFNQKYNGSANFEITEFALMSENELKNQFSIINTENPFSNQETIKSDVSVDIPPSFDYRNYGKVSPVKKQGSCGSCYAFTAVAAIESYYLIHFNKSLDLSEQFGFSCATRSGQCNGGSPSDVLNVSKTVGIPSEACDPYLQVNETCNPKKCGGKERYFIDSYKFYGKDENLIAKNLYLYGPATFCFWVPIEMIYYTGGILDAPGEECRNRSVGGHCMLLVGYTPEYWIAKNSAGVLSGENGFVRFKRFQNFCGFTAGIYGPIRNNLIVTFGTKVFSTTTSSPPVPTGCTKNEAMNDTSRNYVLYQWNGRRSQIAKGQFELRNGTFLPPGKNINKLVYNCSIESMLKSYDSTGKPPNTSDWMFYAYVTKKKLTTMQHIHGIAHFVSHIVEDYVVKNSSYIYTSYTKNFAIDEATSIACWPTTENGLLKARWSMLCGISPIKNASASLYTIGLACKVNANCTKKGYNKCDAIMGLCYH